MILLSTSNSLRLAFHLPPPEPTPNPSNLKWHSLWRIDAKNFPGLGEVMLFTNHETLFTFVADSSKFRSAPDMMKWFLVRYASVFAAKIYPGGMLGDQMGFHANADTSVIGVMTSYFQKVSGFGNTKNHAQLEAWINESWISSRKFSPGEEVQRRLNLGPQG
jgi:hypothetical protein